MPDAPSGTITFLFTDIEGSTRQWEHYPDAMRVALHRHDAIVRSTIGARGGHIFRTLGDSFHAAFTSPLGAIEAAAETQLALQSAVWPQEIGALPVRIALHTGAAEEQQGVYSSLILHQLAHILSAGHGGQILLSATTYQLVQDLASDDIAFADRGEHMLRDLTRPQHIFQMLVHGLPSDFPPLRTLSYRANNLPVNLTPLVGRGKELLEARRLLSVEEVRLLTLTGAGGTGKTRVALQLASDVLEQYADGVWVVELAGLNDQNLVTSTIAQALQVKAGGSEPILKVLETYLKEKQILLVLDNFEHVIDAASEIVHLLTMCANLRVVVTSRIALRVRGEHEYPVPGLSLPDSSHDSTFDQIAESEAVRLFVQRAEAVRPGFKLNSGNAAAVSGICRHLDGLPLAIELAAPALRMFSPEAMLARLSRRLDLPVRGPRDLPSRQQTLRRTMEWSYDLLTDSERQLFCRLAVFRGGENLEAVEAVCNYDGALMVNALDGLDALVSKSLLQVRQGRASEVRFNMLETIYEYALKKLEELPGARALQLAHARYFMQIAQDAEPQLRGELQALWLARLEDDHDNMRTALNTARGSTSTNDLLIGMTLAGSLYRFWLVRGYFAEGREQLTSLLARVSSLDAASNSVDSSGELIAAQAKVLLRLGALVWAQGDYRSARTYLDSSLEIYRAIDDKKGTAQSLLNLGNVDYYQLDYDAARSHYSEALILYQELSDDQGIATALMNIGNINYYLGQVTNARSLMEESLKLRRKLGDRQGIAQTLHSMADVVLSQSDFAVAEAMYTESLAIREELEDRWGIVECLEGLAFVAVQKAEALHKAVPTAVLDRALVSHAVCLLGGAHNLREAIGTPRPRAEMEAYDRIVGTAQSWLGEVAFQEAWHEGRSMSLGAAVAFGLGSSWAGHDSAR
ncbi:MAG TPA: tetratricopeptide repeat protein [Chloroflexia bacterium]|nr:tetratricopeptide repeat protein [Chloroflexia bacterium]